MSPATETTDGVPVTELWTTTQCAQHFGVTRGTWRDYVSTGTPAHLRAPAAVGRQPGRAGESLFPADAVRAWHAGRPGRGARTDLRTER